MYVKKANFEDIEKEYLFIRDIPADENGFMNEWNGIARERFDEVLDIMIANARGEKLPEGFVPATSLFLWKEDEIIGLFRIRHNLSEALLIGAGHIGYFIAKPFRGMGYGTEGLRLTLPIAKELIPEDEIYMRANKNNPASLHVMLNNGGYIHHEDDGKVYVRIRK